MQCKGPRTNTMFINPNLYPAFLSSRDRCKNVALLQLPVALHCLDDAFEVLRSKDIPSNAKNLAARHTVNKNGARNKSKRQQKSQKTCFRNRYCPLYGKKLVHIATSLKKQGATTIPTFILTLSISHPRFWTLAANLPSIRRAKRFCALSRSHQQHHWIWTLRTILSCCIMDVNDYSPSWNERCWQVPSHFPTTRGLVYFYV